MYEKIKSLVLKVRPLAVGLSPSARLIEDVGLDSLGLLEFSALVEDQCGVVFETRHLYEIRTLGDVARFVAEARRADAEPLSERAESGA